MHTDAKGPTPVLVARATRLVVVSAGTFGSPPILERSGVGAKATLEKYGVVQVVDLPGVGENYQGACCRRCSRARKRAGCRGDAKFEADTMTS